MFDSDRFGDDILNDLFAGSFTKMAEEETSKVCVKTFVSGYELVGEGQAWHETTFLEPKDGRERSGEEDALDCSKCNETFSEA